MEQFRVAGFTDNRREGSGSGRTSMVRVSFVEVPYPGTPELVFREPGEASERFRFDNGNDVELSAAFEERGAQALLAENVSLIVGSKGVYRIQWCY